MEKVFFDSIDDLCPTFSYEEIISGRVPLHELDIERIEVSTNIHTLDDLLLFFY